VGTEFPRSGPVVLSPIKAVQGRRSRATLCTWVRTWATRQFSAHIQWTMRITEAEAMDKRIAWRSLIGREAQACALSSKASRVTLLSLVAV
jgi:uncharacterized membrane protein